MSPELSSQGHSLNQDVRKHLEERERTLPLTCGRQASLTPLLCRWVWCDVCGCPPGAAGDGVAGDRSEAPALAKEYGPAPAPGAHRGHVIERHIGKVTGIWFPRMLAEEQSREEMGCLPCKKRKVVPLKHA